VSVREGGCACGRGRYRLAAEPLWVQACHCLDCQRLSGAAFAVNLWVEESTLELTAGRLHTVALTGGSGAGHDLSFCPRCGTHLWSRYRRAPPGVVFVRAGTLDDTSWVVPGAHIFTRSRQPWVVLPEGVPAFEASYSPADVWPGEALERLRAVGPGAETS
jgi:hypothetical protein